MYNLDLEKAEESRDQIANTCWIIEKAREFQKNIHFCFTDYAKAFNSVDHNKLWKTLKEIEIPDHLTCLLRNLYAGQEATVRTECETTTVSKLGKKYIKAIYSQPFYLTYTEYTMQNAWLDEPQAGIKIAWRNINNLRYGNGTTLMEKKEEELETLGEGESGEWKSWLKLSIQKTKIMASTPITSWQIGGGKIEK